MTVTRSPGIELSPYFPSAGGGGRGCTDIVDAVVNHAAHQLSLHYHGADVTIRFNSDRRSGGAWLHTHKPDRVGYNAEVGITASLIENDIVALAVRISPWGHRDRDLDETMQVDVPDVAAAIRVVELEASPTVAEIQARIVEATANYRERHLRQALVTRIGRARDLTLVTASDSAHGLAILNRLTTTKRGKQLFGRYAATQRIRVEGGFLASLQGAAAYNMRVPWQTAQDMDPLTVYRVNDAKEVSEVWRYRPRASPTVAR